MTPRFQLSGMVGVAYRGGMDAGQEKRSVQILIDQFQTRPTHCWIHSSADLLSPRQCFEFSSASYGAQVFSYEGRSRAAMRRNAPVQLEATIAAVQVTVLSVVICGLG